MTDTLAVAPDGITDADLLRRLLVATARQTAMKAVVDDLRDAMRKRAIAHQERTGVPWRAPLRGVGTALMTDPEERVVVGDDGMLAAWAADQEPGMVSASITVRATALEAVLEALDGVVDAGDRPVTLTADPAWVKGLIASCAVAPGETADAPQVIDPQGRIVDGLTVTRTPANLSVKLDPQAKARAVAEYVDPDRLPELVDDLPGGLDPVDEGVPA